MTFTQLSAYIVIRAHKIGLFIGQVGQIPFHPKVVASSYEGRVRKVRKPQNWTKNNKKPQYRIEIYRNTETAGCPRQDLQSFYPLKIRPAVYADVNSNAKLLNY